MKDSRLINRRKFLESTAVTGILGAFALPSNVAANDAPPKTTTSGPTLGYPLLQNVSETSASVSWALTTPSTGWVEWGPTPDFGKIARNSEFGLNPYETDFLSARLTGLITGRQPVLLNTKRHMTKRFPSRFIVKPILSLRPVAVKTKCHSTL